MNFDMAFSVTKSYLAHFSLTLASRSVTFYSVTGRHTPARGATGRPFLYCGPVLRPYTKPHATPTDRVRHLRTKGLVVKRPNVAAQKIEKIGYERLRIYFLSRRDAPGKMFRTGTTYNDILQLYNCDARLRGLCFEAVGRFELAFRNTLSEILSARHGSHPYDALAAFKDAKAQDQARLQVLQVYLKSRDERARHYRNTYNSPAMPPVWMFKEFLTFGATAKLYSHLANDVRDEIAKAFGVGSVAVFDNWVLCFVDLRNICAHHDRLFNRRFQKQPQRLRRASVPTATPNTLKALLECLDYVLSSAGESAGTVTQADRIMRLKIHEAANPSEAGF